MAARSTQGLATQIPIPLYDLSQYPIKQVGTESWQKVLLRKLKTNPLVRIYTHTFIVPRPDGTFHAKYARKYHGNIFKAPTSQFAAQIPAMINRVLINTTRLLPPTDPFGAGQIPISEKLFPRVRVPPLIST